MKIKYVLPFILTTLGCAGVNSQSSPLLKAPPPAHVESPELQKASPNNAQIAWRPLSESTMLEAKTNKKFMFVVFKTSWCEFCKKLETELTDPKISAFVNENFIPVVVQDDDSTILFFSNWRSGKGSISYYDDF